MLRSLAAAIAASMFQKNGTKAELHASMSLKEDRLKSFFCNDNMITNIFGPSKIDDLVKSQFCRIAVIPANAGIQWIQYVLDADSSPTWRFKSFLHIIVSLGFSNYELF